MERERSGIALFRSIAIVRPKPRHAGQAPSGLLKLKSPGVGGRMSRSQCAQCHPVEKGSSVIADSGMDLEGAALSAPLLARDGAWPSKIGTTLIRSFPNRSAISIASVSLAR